MRNLFTLFVLIGMSLGVQSVWGQCSDLFISEYIEGSSNNKAVEIYNPTAASIDLTDYVLYRYSNGATTPNDSLFPQGMISAYGVYVIGNSSASAAITSVSDTTHNLTLYNGNDALSLIKISTSDTLDIIGIIGNNPGASWPVGTGATRDFTLVRMAGVDAGTTDWAVGATQWDVHPQDDFGFIGSHGSSCDPNYVPVYPIGLVTADNDGDGLGDSVGVSAEFVGVVHGVDLQGNPSNVQFTLIDGTGGIGVANFGDSFGYTVTEGDEVRVPGTIGHFNGLTQIGPDTIIVLSTGNPLQIPMTITSLDESTESEMIRFEHAWLVNPADWPTSTGNKNMDVTNGMDTILVRIDSDTDIDGTVGPPADTFNVVGIGGQFDSSSPHLDGYQLLPRYLADFTADTAVIYDSGLPKYAIDLVTNDAIGDGLGDSLGVACQLTGIVHGVDMQGSPSNIQFTIIDATGGISVTNFSNSFGYDVTEGDSVVVAGVIDDFNGLTQMDPDTIVYVSSGNALSTPAVITSLDESTESEMVRFNNAVLIDANQWPNAGSSANVEITNGSDTITVRIDSDTDIDGSPAPTDTFDIVGIGGQFDNSAPHLSGYQLLPRYMPDVMPTMTGFNGLPIYPIDLVSNDGDGDGRGDSVGVACEVRGVVHGVDLDGDANDLVFTIIDGTGGMGVANFGNALGYTVNEGDSIHVAGSVTEFRGLTQMGNLDTIIFISSGNPIQTPVAVTSLGEDTEGEVIQFNNAYLITPSQWPGSGSSANVDVTNGTDTITVRIDSDTDVDGMPAPSGLFNVAGIGGQFTFDDPPLDGYQLLPRYMPDIMDIPAPGFSFSATSATVGESGGSVAIGVQLPTAFPDTTTVDVSINLGTSTATATSDFNNWMDTTLTFPAGNVGPLMLSVDIIDDMEVESDETIIVELSNPTSGPVLGDSVMTITIEDNDFPQYPIGILTADSDMDGIGDSLGVVCQVQGIVYGIDFQGNNNIQFTVIDSTGGINIFNFGDELGYTVQEGDEVLVPGEVVVFNGLTELDPDTIIVLSTGNPLGAPAVVTNLDESTESEFIRMECLALLDTSQWPTSGGSVNLQATNGVDTFTVRIDSDTDINGTLPPTKKWLNITGLGGQFDGSTPPVGGYQILPRYQADIEERPDPTVSFEVIADSAGEGDGSYTLIITQTDGNPDSSTVGISLDEMGSTAINGDDFSFVPTTVRLGGCGESSVSISITILEDADMEGDETIVLFLNETTNNVIKGIDTITVTIVDNDAGAISDLLPQGAISMFPNPADQQVQLQSSYHMEQISVRNLLGQELLHKSNVGLETALNISQLPAGVYLILVNTDEGMWRQRLLIE
ncbi:MAG: Calx-beta domain-containing protein [Bacteroidota bacterium]